MIKGLTIIAIDMALREYGVDILCSERVLCDDNVTYKVKLCNVCSLTTAVKLQELVIKQLRLREFGIELQLIHKEIN